MQRWSDFIDAEDYWSPGLARIIETLRLTLWNDWRKLNLDVKSAGGSTIDAPAQTSITRSAPLDVPPVR